MAPDVRPDFSGKVVKVFTTISDPKWQWWSLTEPVLERQEGRLFLGGRLTDPGSRGSFWGGNTIACVPRELIQCYPVETSPERQQRKYGDAGTRTLPGM